jgi:para-nitrobenzyl esterase
VYPAATEEEVLQSAGDLASDNFIVHGTWKWIEMQAKAGAPIYRFQFDREVPIPDARKSAGVETLGAVHASELEYVFETFAHKKADWQPEDEALGQKMNAYWANFIKTGNPNGPGLPNWPEFGKSQEQMHFNAQIRSQPEMDRARHVFLDSVISR